MSQESSINNILLIKLLWNKKPAAKKNSTTTTKYNTTKEAEVNSSGDKVNDNATAKSTPVDTDIPAANPNNMLTKD